jgi:uncharacterized repeat protein (TIGR03803 family)
LVGKSLYGTTSGGGAGSEQGSSGMGYGTIFTLPISGGTVTTLASFTGVNGSSPKGGLALVGGKLYGTSAGAPFFVPD